MATMLRLLTLTGMRPGEVCDLHSSEIDRSAAVWVFKPSMHKGRSRGKVREVFIGPQAQEILAPLLRPGFIFLTRTGKRWTEALLYAAVRNACIKHRLPSWSPNQIRHTVATQLRASDGLDTAQAVLGHARIETTQVYAERRRELGTAAALRFG